MNEGNTTVKEPDFLSMPQSPKTDERRRWEAETRIELRTYLSEQKIACQDTIVNDTMEVKQALDVSERGYHFSKW